MRQGLLLICKLFCFPSVCVCVCVCVCIVIIVAVVLYRSLTHHRCFFCFLLPYLNSWSCDGSFMPVTAPSLMPAGQVQPSTSMMPVPATPTATMTCANIPFPGDGTSCVGVLPAGLSSATCNYSQTITTDGVPVSESATCECDSSNVWNCQGSFTPAPPNAVPVVPTDMMPILSGVPEPTEMPILSGVPAPTEMPILSGVPAPTDMPILSGVPAPTATLPPAAPSDGSIAIPDSVNFSSGSAICPAKITNCEPCAQFFEGAIEGSCSQFTQVSYLGVPTTFRIQCRCPLQSITNPTWSCVFIGGDEGTYIFTYCLFFYIELIYNIYILIRL
jgi:hypothetical protein